MSAPRLTITGIATYQDHGRHHQHVGVPTSGAFDQHLARLATTLIDSPDTPLLEILAGQITLTLPGAALDLDGTPLTAQHPPLTLAIVGNADATITHSTHTPVPAPAGMTFQLLPARTLTVRTTGHGPVYLAIAGLRIPTTLGSSSYDTLSGLGPAPLPSTELTVDTDDQDRLGRFITTPHLTPLTAPHQLRYIPGPHAPTPDALDGTWAVTSTARSGIRLHPAGPAQRPHGTASLASVPVTPGTIQLPPDGNPIILGPDAGVTGGYSIAGHIISADLHLLAHLSAQSPLALTAVTPTQARAAWAATNRTLQRAVTDITHLL